MNKIAAAMVAGAATLALLGEPVAHADPQQDADAQALRELKAAAYQKLDAAGVPGDRLGRDAAISTMCNYLKGEIPNYQAAIAIPTNLSNVLDKPVLVTTAQLEALQAVATMPPRVVGNGDQVAICPIEHPERVPKRMAAVEACQNPTATFAKDRCPWDPQHGYGDGA
jgi:hypothetical protein